MSRYKIAILSLLAFHSVTSFANEFPDEGNKVLAVEMSKCLGAQEAVADMKKAMGKVKGAELSRSIANGTRIAAEQLFYQSGMSQKNIADAVNSYSYKTKLIVSQDFETSFTAGKSPDIAIKIMTECSERLMPLQKSIVEQLRKEMYK